MRLVNSTREYAFVSPAFGQLPVRCSIEDGLSLTQAPVHPRGPVFEDSTRQRFKCHSFAARRLRLAVACHPIAASLGVCSPTTAGFADTSIDDC
jgi:hypothetical protein